ncbi:MAG: hypothetical protein J0M12_17840 [Deltaproteobacteria bacterium]|nr:hypothetical protein [Deltaproteobacteria bacterium]
MRVTLLCMLALGLVAPAFAQEEDEQRLVTKPTPWVRDSSETLDPEATATPFAPSRPEYKRRRSAQQIMEPERDPDARSSDLGPSKAQEDQDYVFGQ